MELIRKRERLKREHVKLEEIMCKYTLQPLNILLSQVIDKLKAFDQARKIFTNPVDPIQVPVYYEVIKQPMDLSKMQTKIDKLEYETFDEFENDFKKII